MWASRCARSNGRNAGGRCTTRVPLAVFGGPMTRPQFQEPVRGLAPNGARGLYKRVTFVSGPRLLDVLHDAEIDDLISRI